MTQLATVIPQELFKTSSPIFAGATLTGLTPSRLVATDAASKLTSVSNLASWIAGMSNRITVADDGDGTITLSGPQDIHTGASPAFAGLTLSGLTQQRIPFTVSGGQISNSENLVFFEELAEYSNYLRVGTGPGVLQSVFTLGIETTGQMVVSTGFSNGVWIDLPTTGPSGIGTGGAGSSCWLGYSATNGQWFNDSVAGDLNFRNFTAYKSLNFGTGIDSPTVRIKSNSCQVKRLYAGSISTMPLAHLHLAAGTTSSSTAPLKFTSGTSLSAPEVGAIEFTTDNLYLTITTGVARKGFILDDGAGLTSGRLPYATTNGRLTDSANLVFSGTALKLGNGSATPAIFDCTTQTDVEYPFFLTAYGATNPVPGIVGRSARGTLASPTPTQANDYIMAFGGRGYHTGGFAGGSSCSVMMYAAENFTSTAQGAYMAFETTPIGSTSRAKRMRIDNNGVVSVGQATTSISNLLNVTAGTGATYLQVRDFRSNTGDLAGIKFSSTPNGYGDIAKTMIAHIETGAYGIGSLVFALNSSADAVDVSIANEKMRLTPTGLGIFKTPTVALDVVGAIQTTTTITAGTGFVTGSSNDLAIYHDGTNSYIYNDTGLLKIQDAGSGINLGTTTSELLGFYGVTPVNQPDTVADAATQDLTGANTVDQTKLEADLTSCRAAINLIIDRLQEIGLVA